MNSTCFTFYGSTYEQTYGLTYFSYIIANTVLEDLEEEYMSKLNEKPII